MSEVLTYEEALKECPPTFTLRRLKRASSSRTPLHLRLAVTRLGHRTVVIRREKLQSWLRRITE